MKSLKAQLPKPFSIPKIEKKAVEVAKALRPVMQDIKTLRENNCEGFCSYLQVVANVPYPVAKAMLSHFMPMQINAFNMFRLALAIMYYLPEVSKTDTSLQDLQKTLPQGWAHVRVTDVNVRENSPGRFYAYVEVLFMDTVAAGRLQEFSMPCTWMRGIFKSIGLRNRIRETDVVNPRELVGMYASVHVVENDKRYIDIDGWTVNDSERKRNRDLSRLRKKKECSFVDTECVNCMLGKDKCALACRKKTVGGIDGEPGEKSGRFISTVGKQAEPRL